MTVHEVVTLYERMDATGLAAKLHENSVNGADLLRFEADTLAHDLRVAPFAARKILTIRDGFLDRPR